MSCRGSYTTSGPSELAPVRWRALCTVHIHKSLILHAQVLEVPFVASFAYKGASMIQQQRIRFLVGRLWPFHCPAHHPNDWYDHHSSSHRGSIMEQVKWHKVHCTDCSSLWMMHCLWWQVLFTLNQCAVRMLSDALSARLIRGGVIVCER